MAAPSASATGTAGPNWVRLGDYGVCFIFCLFGSVQIIKTYLAIADGDPLVALHQALVGVAATIMAGLPLLRRQAIAKGAGLRDRTVAVVGTFAIMPVGALSLTWQPDWLLTLTSIGFIACYLWIIWALLTLKRSFSIFPEARRLVTHGPYGLVRHPLYFAYFGTYTLVTLPRIGIWAVAFTAIGIACEVLRARNEERVLRSVFPEYDAYAQRVRAFWPINRPTPTTSPAISTPAEPETQPEQLVA